MPTDVPLFELHLMYPELVFRGLSVLASAAERRTKYISEIKQLKWWTVCQKHGHGATTKPEHDIKWNSHKNLI